MSKAKYFNKGVLKGTVAKSELIDFDGKTGKSKFLSVEIFTGNSNRIKATVFPTKTNPSKPQELNKEYPVNSVVEISGNVRESEYESKNGGKKGIDRSVSAIAFRPLASDVKHNATFILQGDVLKIKEVADGVEITIEVQNEYEKDGEKKVSTESFTLAGDKSIIELISDVDLNKGCNAKFKGLILNKLEFDDYGDIVGSVQKFQVEKIEDVLQADELGNEEEVPFL